MQTRIDSEIVAGKVRGRTDQTSLYFDVRRQQSDPGRRADLIRAHNQAHREWQNAATADEVLAALDRKKAAWARLQGSRG
jgi:hypothetical protein